MRLVPVSCQRLESFGEWSAPGSGGFCSLPLLVRPAGPPVSVLALGSRPVFDLPPIAAPRQTPSPAPPKTAAALSRAPQSLTLARSALAPPTNPRLHAPSCRYWLVSAQITFTQSCCFQQKHFFFALFPFGFIQLSHLQ